MGEFGKSVTQGFGGGCGCLMVPVVIILFLIFLGAMFGGSH
jgi:hypothetical protein